MHVSVKEEDQVEHLLQHVAVKEDSWLVGCQFSEDLNREFRQIYDFNVHEETVLKHGNDIWFAGETGTVSVDFEEVKNTVHDLVGKLWVLEYVLDCLLQQVKELLEQHLSVSEAVFTLLLWVLDKNISKFNHFVDNLISFIPDKGSVEVFNILPHFVVCLELPVS